MKRMTLSVRRSYFLACFFEIWLGRISQTLFAKALSRCQTCADDKMVLFLLSLMSSIAEAAVAAPLPHLHLREEVECQRLISILANIFIGKYVSSTSEFVVEFDTILQVSTLDVN